MKEFGRVVATVEAEMLADIRTAICNLFDDDRSEELLTFLEKLKEEHDETAR